jgi:hypothetical protein
LAEHKLRGLPGPKVAAEQGEEELCVGGNLADIPRVLVAVARRQRIEGGDVAGLVQSSGQEPRRPA